MKNNKGFSILELIVSFSICMIVVVVLFQIVLVLKEMYEKSSIKTEMLNKQNLIVDQIYTDILERGLTKVENCSSDNKCAKFIFKDNVTKTFRYNSGNLQYGNYATTLSEGHKVSDTGIEVKMEDGVASIYLEITHQLFSNTDFGIRIVHRIS